MGLINAMDCRKIEMMSMFIRQSNSICFVYLGTGESGKSTLTKQMRIIHINGFDMR
jgi:hypothetical protein